MDEETGGVPEGGPPAPPGTADELFRQAESSRHRQVWEESIRLYRFSLQKDPRRIDALFGLALCHEAKSREPGYESYLESAMGEYRKIIELDPSCGKAHDGLLAAAAKAGLLGDLVEEYKSRLARDPGSQSIRDALRKLQTMFLLQTSPKKKAEYVPPPALSFLFGLVAPGLAVVTMIGSLLLRLKGGEGDVPSMISFALAKLSFFCFIAFLGYKVFVYWRASR